MLPKNERLVSGDEIRTVLKTKQIHFSSPLLHFTALVVDRPNSRWVVITPKRLGTAVVRNRARRLVMSVVHGIKRYINKNIDIVVMVRQVGFSKSSLESDLLAGLRRVGLCA